MSHHELIQRLHGENATLQEQIDELSHVADRAPHGIRQYRRHRIDQIRERHTVLQDRIRRVEAHADEWDAIRPEAERLYLDLRNTQDVVGRTFH
jgi:uncharacterized protein YdcH (DUF465 family)